MATYTYECKALAGPAYREGTFNSVSDAIIFEQEPAAVYIGEVRVFTRLVEQVITYMERYALGTFEVKRMP